MGVAIKKRTGDWGVAVRVSDNLCLKKGVNEGGEIGKQYASEKEENVHKSFV